MMATVRGEAVPMRARRQVRRALGLIGSVIATAAMVAILHRLRSALTPADWALAASHAWLLGAAAVVYAGLVVAFMAEAFHGLLGGLGEEGGRRQSWRFFCTSQIGKYVPGNVVHLAWRQALGRSAGLPHGALARASVYELSGAALAAACYAPMLAQARWASGLPPGAGVVAAGAALTAVVIGARRFFGRGLSNAILLYAVFFGLSAGLFAAIWQVLGGQGTALPVVIGAYVVSWLIGFATPGAPAGIGVRDYALVAMIGQDDPSVVLAATFIRLVTFAGDVLVYLFGLALGIKRSEAKDRRALTACATGARQAAS